VIGQENHAVQGLIPWTLVVRPNRRAESVLVVASVTGMHRFVVSASLRGSSPRHVCNRSASRSEAPLVDIAVILNVEKVECVAAMVGLHRQRLAVTRPPEFDLIDG
jgi:hypothetical protein